MGSIACDNISHPNRFHGTLGRISHRAHAGLVKRRALAPLASQRRKVDIHRVQRDVVLLRFLAARPAVRPLFRCNGFHETRRVERLHAVLLPGYSHGHALRGRRRLSQLHQTENPIEVGSGPIVVKAHPSPYRVLSMKPNSVLKMFFSTLQIELIE